MATLSFDQLKTLWVNAGGPVSTAPTAAAIAQAESGGDPTALNPTDNGGKQSSFGLWQVSTGTHAAPSPSWADPATNAQLAVAKYTGAGNSFTPWGTYHSVNGKPPAYLAFLQRAGGGRNVTGTATPAPSTAPPGAGSMTPWDWLQWIFAAGTVGAMPGASGQVIIDKAGKAGAQAVTDPNSPAAGLGKIADQLAAAQKSFQDWFTKAKATAPFLVVGVGLLIVGLVFVASSASDDVPPAAAAAAA